MRIEAPDPPQPPEEWRPYRREKMLSCIEAAYLFIVKGLSADDIKRAINRPGVSRSRIGQLVARGTKFFLDRGYVSVVRS